MVDDDSSTRVSSTDLDDVTDYAGVRIGSASARGFVADFAGIRIGTVDADGSVVDFAGVRIGHLVRSV